MKFIVKNKRNHSNKWTIFYQKIKNIFKVLKQPKKIIKNLIQKKKNNFMKMVSQY